MSERDPRGNHLECSRCAEEFAFVDSLILHWRIFHGSPYGRLYEGKGATRLISNRRILSAPWLIAKLRAKRAEREQATP